MERRAVEKERRRYSAYSPGTTLKHPEPRRSSVSQNIPPTWLKPRTRRPSLDLGALLIIEAEPLDLETRVLFIPETCARAKHWMPK